MRRAALLVLLSAACASKPQPPPLLPSVVPRAVIEVLCAHLRAEGMTSEVRAVTTTQPLVNAATLQALAQAEFYHGRASFDPADVIHGGAISVDVAPGACITRTIEGINVRRDSDVMVLEFSQPFVSPFARRESGVVARLSLGNEAATWYWVPIGERNGRWAAGAPVPLALQ